MWTILGFAISMVGLYLFSAAYTFRRGEFSVDLQPLWPLLLVLVLLFVLFLVHELIHGVTMRAFGARPSYGIGAVAGGLLPYFYCTAPGHRFSRGQYISVALTPALVVSLVGALWTAFLPLGGWLVVPLGLHLGGCISDFWLTVLVLRKPGGTLVEDRKTGVRFFVHQGRPTASARGR